MKDTQVGFSTLRQFKDEWRLKCTDSWGDAMEVWFECAGWLHWNGENIPIEWEYSPGAGGDGRDKESYWYELFAETPVSLLHEIGRLMTRYCQYLRFKGLDY